MGSAPIVRPPTESALHPAAPIASTPRGPISARPSGLIVVMRASMYSEDCRPDANVNVPRLADRVARSERRSLRRDMSVGGKWSTRRLTPFSLPAWHGPLLTSADLNRRIFGAPQRRAIAHGRRLDCQRPRDAPIGNGAGAYRCAAI